MDIRITSTKAKEILECFTDWDTKTKTENKERYEGYLDGVKDVMTILGLTKDELKQLSKK
jgi:dimeric dUTPase (all-alpha-NTP-PPase superfamily)